MIQKENEKFRKMFIVTEYAALSQTLCQKGPTFADDLKIEFDLYFIMLYPSINFKLN